MNSEARDRGVSLAAAGALLGAVLWPLRQHWRAEPVDGFPLSYYPMFSAKRKRTASVTHLVGVDANGACRRLPYSYAGAGGLNQVRRQLASMVADGLAEATCAAVAEAVRGRGRTDCRDLIEVRVVTGTYRYADFFAGRTEAIREIVHARVALPAPGSPP